MKIISVTLYDKMVANRKWMYRRTVIDNEVSLEYMDGVDSFIEFATDKCQYSGSHRSDQVPLHDV